MGQIFVAFSEYSKFFVAHMLVYQLNNARMRRRSTSLTVLSVHVGSKKEQGKAFLFPPKVQFNNTIRNLCVYLDRKRRKIKIRMQQQLHIKLSY